MAHVKSGKKQAPGFFFGSSKIVEKLKKRGLTFPKFTKTGTTIAGVIFKDGVVLGADTRATEDTTVSDKNCMKIHYLAPNMYCCGAGTAADTEMTTKLVSSQLKLHTYFTGRSVPVRAANQILKQMLFRYQGNIGAALVLGGVDEDGYHLYSIYPHGSSDKLPFTAMGSGTLAAIAHFEMYFQENMSEEDAIKLVRNGITGGIFNDLGSGSNVDICVIRKAKVDYMRNYEIAEKKGTRQSHYLYPYGTTVVLKYNLENVDVEEYVDTDFDATMDQST